MAAGLKRTACVALLTAGCSVAPAATETPLPGFEKQVLSEEFLAEGAQAGDLNRDGIADVVAGPYWYEGPDFQNRREYYPAEPFDPEQYSNNFFAFLHDFNEDGWNDILVLGFPGEDVSWFENPQGGEGFWTRHEVFTGLGSESPTWVDLTGDGRAELVGLYDGAFGYVVPDSSDPERPWTFHPISPQGSWGRYTHGLGVGDVNGDGRDDLLTADGWWEHPETLDGDPVWIEHDVDFGTGGAQMFAHDANGDGLNDVITSLDAHGYGLAWFEQVEVEGRRTFERHLIMSESPATGPFEVGFSQVHAVEVIDVDGDGVKDIVTGKRFWAHGSSGDPEPNAPPVLYWFRTTREEGGAGVSFQPVLIDDDSGVGVQLVVTDVDGDGRPDIVTSNKKGTAVMRQR